MGAVYRVRDDLAAEHARLDRFRQVPHQAEPPAHPAQAAVEAPGQLPDGAVARVDELAPPLGDLTGVPVAAGVREHASAHAAGSGPGGDGAIEVARTSGPIQRRLRRGSPDFCEGITDHRHPPDARQLGGDILRLVETAAATRRRIHGNRDQATSRHIVAVEGARRHADRHGPGQP